MSGGQPTAAQQAQRCPTCADDPKAAPGRYCAPDRCYCGHAECPAVASYVPRRAPLDNVHPITREAP